MTKEEHKLIEHWRTKYKHKNDRQRKNTLFADKERTQNAKEEHKITD